MLRSDRPKVPSGRQTVTERFVDSGLRADIVAVNKPVLPTGVAIDPSCLQYALTEAERIEFDERGYIVLEDLLTENQITDLEKACDAADREVREERGIGPHARLTVRDVMWRDPSLLELVDLPTALPKMWELLGWNIQIYHTVIAYSPPDAPENREVKHQGWHQDSGQLNRDLEYSPRPMVSLKVAYFLSDCMEEGMANFWVVPGSQLVDYVRPEDRSVPEGAVPVFVPRGGAVVFGLPFTNARLHAYGSRMTPRRIGAIWFRKNSPTGGTDRSRRCGR